MINLVWFLSIFFASAIQIFLAVKTKIIYGIIIPLLYSGFFVYALITLKGPIPNYVFVGYALPIVLQILIFVIFFIKKETR